VPWKFSRTPVKIGPPPKPAGDSEALLANPTFEFPGGQSEAPAARPSLEPVRESR
jgi:hypothetical protein